MKQLITVGDSFTYGEELADRTSAWPQLLANKLNYSLVNLGLPSASNDKILRKTIDYVVNEPLADLVVIGWSNIGRSEHADEFGYYDVWPGYQGNLFKQDNTEWRNQLVDYVSRYHNSESIHLKFLQQVILLQRYLKSVNIPYVMLNIVQNEYYKKKIFPGYLKYHEQINKDTFLGFNDSGMLEWTYGCDKGPAGHFLEAGHKIVANKIYEHIGNLGWLP
jgi:lysophospholipase L1-like esterase